MSTANNNLNPLDKHRGYVVASRTNAAFYVDSEDHRFQVLTRLSSPEGDYKERDLDSDRPGKTSVKGAVMGHALDRTFQRHEEVAKRFSQLVSEKIDYFRKEQGWDELVLVAEPHFLGLLKSALKPQVRKMLRREVPQGVPSGVTGRPPRTHSQGTKIRN